jgi:hypothetical protein
VLQPGAAVANYGSKDVGLQAALEEVLGLQLQLGQLLHACQHPLFDGVPLGRPLKVVGVLDFAQLELPKVGQQLQARQASMLHAEVAQTEGCKAL